MKYPDDFINKIICGSALEVLKTLPDESIQMSICSPPYYGLRDYKTGKWEGGNSKCEHIDISMIGGQGEASQKQHTNKGTQFIQYKDECKTCGAKRIDSQIGLEKTPQLYLEKLWAIFDEVNRVLKKDGVIFVNLGDTYGGSCQGASKNTKDRVEGKVKENLGSSQRYLEKYGHTLTSKPPTAYLQPKCLLMIPERFALGMIERGWILRNKICWFKRNAMPSSVKDRFTCTWEYIYFFSKSRRYYFDLDRVRIPLKTVTLERYDRNYGSPDNKYNDQDPKVIGGAKIDLRPKEYKFNYRVRDAEKKKEQCPQFKASEKEIKNYHNKTADQSYKIGGMKPCLEPNDLMYYLNKYFYKQNNDWLCKACHTSISKHKQGSKNRNQNIGSMISDTGFYYENSLIKWCNPLGKNPGDHWDITTKGYKEAHFAVYPEELCLMPIKAGSKPGDIVLDPFAGAGTTCLVAKKLGRNYLGIDLNPDYCQMAQDRIEKECGTLF